MARFGFGVPLILLRVYVAFAKHSPLPSPARIRVFPQPASGQPISVSQNHPSGNCFAALNLRFWRNSTMRFTRLIVIVVAAWAVLQSASFAQSFDPVLETGIQPFQSYDGTVDAVNVATGQLSLHIPIVSFPQRGGRLHLNYQIVPRQRKWDSLRPEVKLHI